jgi:P27 family predicted phage terminase small subunit
MKVEMWPVDKPVPYAKNARKIGDRAVDKIASSIQAFGFRQPLVVDKNGVIVVGHARLMGAKKLGLKLVPVHRAESLTPAQIRSYRLADNRTNQETEWDTERLCEELKDLMVQDFDLALTGFDPDEITAYTVETTDGLTDEDETPAVPEIAITEAGDLWMLSHHRLLCGDSTSTDAVERLMDGQKADLAVTDPPYNVDYEGKTKDKLRIQNDKMSDERFVAFLRDVYTGLALTVKDGAAVYVFHADTFGHYFRQEFIDAGFHLSGVCIWKKQTIVMGRSDFHWKHEPVLYGWKNGASHAWYGDRKQSTVWEFDRPTRSDLHPTMKPVALIEYPLNLSSKSGDMVLDLFGGSGSTLIGCEKTGRSARLMELDPKYCDVIVRRGPAPKPTAIKKAEGNPGKRKLNTQEPQPLPGVPGCPDHLDAVARKEWGRLSEILMAMKVLTEADYIALGNLCQAYSTLIDAQKHLNKSGILFKTPSGYIQQNPLLGIIGAQTRIVNDLLREFGLTPASRTRITIEKPDTSDEDLWAILSQPRVKRVPDVQ